MESLHYLLMRCYAGVSRRVMARAGEMGLSAGQPKVLDFLLAAGEADQRTIAAHCQIEPATVGGILLRMEKAGLVERSRREEDRRAVRVRLTVAGRRAAQAMEEVFRQAEAPAAAALTEEEMARLKELLQKVSRALEQAQRGESV
ncbi:MAG: MarR family transcriptional regulator [Oscillospiraceae bacterium]|nr:MarR family transcriptional regulator [Oscillospiraceae bacterium]